jgi:hypothetical protein
MSNRFIDDLKSISQLNSWKWDLNSSSSSNLQGIVDGLFTVLRRSRYLVGVVSSVPDRASLFDIGKRVFYLPDSPMASRSVHNDNVDNWQLPRGRNKINSSVDNTINPATAKTRFTKANNKWFN